ncbi:MAG: carbohydrate ABC transporter permease [Clostridia bacterium]|nr:carbohydrate ABC transporter permease [Clostridia bacterium]
MNTKTRKRNTVWWFILTLILMLFTIAPVIWFMMVSVQPEAVATAGGLTFNFTPTLDNYINVFGKMNYLAFFKNSSIICFSSTLIVVILASLSAFGFTRKKNKFTSNLSYWVLSNKMFPPIAIVIPIYLMMSGLKLLDTYTGMMLVYTAANLPYAVWMLMSFFDDIPIALDEAATVDGCTKGQALVRIVMPLASPGILSTGIFIFVLTWSEFLMALLLTGTNTKTLPVAIAAFINDRGIEWGPMAAAGTSLIIPLAVLFYSIKRYLVRGLAFGAVKE